MDKNSNDIKTVYDIYPIRTLKENTYDGLLISVAHDKFKNLGKIILKVYVKKIVLIYDLKNLFKSNKIDLRL